MLHKRPAQLAQLLPPTDLLRPWRPESVCLWLFEERGPSCPPPPSRARGPSRACAHGHKQRALIHICFSEKKAAGEEGDGARRASEPIEDNGGVIGSGAAHSPGGVAFQKATEKIQIGGESITAT